MRRSTEDYDDNSFTKLVKACSDTDKRAETMYVFLKNRGKDIDNIIDSIKENDIPNRSLSTLISGIPFKAECYTIDQDICDLVLDDFQKEVLSRLDQYGVTIYTTVHNEYVKQDVTGHPTIHSATMAHLAGEENRDEYIKQCIYTINSFFEVYTGEPLFPNISPEQTQEKTDQTEEDRFTSEERFNLMMAMHFAQQAFRGKE